MLREQETDRDGNRWVRWLAVSLLASCLAPGVARADASWVTLQDILDAITGEKTFSEQQLQELDISRDGAVDIVDVACFHNGCHKEVSFTLIEQTVDESDGTLMVAVQFEVPLTGTLNYSVDGGTATSGDDFTALTGTVSVNGVSSANIAVPLINDTMLSEQIETIILQLEPGVGYQVGAPSRHTIFITDDDALWRGVLEIDSGLVPISMQIVSSGSSYTGSIISDGLGTFPLDAQGEAQTWTASVDLSDTAFSATVDPITMSAADSGACATSFTRTFTFGADEMTQPLEHVVAPRVIRGDFQEQRAFASRPYLDHDVTGFFQLMKEMPIASDYEAPLEDVVP